MISAEYSSGETVVQHAMDWLLERLSKITRVHSVILYGSRARGDHLERSDIDLAIEAPGIGTLEWDFIQELAENAPTLHFVEIVNLDRIDTKFRERILKEGVILYARENTRTVS